MTTNQIFETRDSSKSPIGQANPISRFLANTSLSWKVILIVIVLFLGTLGVTGAGYYGLQSMRYQISNIYDFMLIPIVAINHADSALADAQFLYENIDEVKGEQQANNFSEIQADTKLVDETITRYDNEWVTTTSPEFTQSLQDAGKLELQQQEIAALADFHKEFDAYKVASDQYVTSAQKGTPNADLANVALTKLELARKSLQALIDINTSYADFSNNLAQNAFRQALITGALALIIGLAVGVILSYLIAVSITSRLSDLTRSATAMQKGDLDQTIAIEGRDEVSLLGTTFNLMSSQLKGLIGSLEQRVAERTRNLELAAEVGRSVSQVRALDVMLTDAAELIRDQFNLYYVQVYLVNPSQTFLDLQAGTGNVGKELLQRSHRLPYTVGSINGRAAVEKRPVVIPDTVASASFRPNPLLPETRSEMAIPLIVSDKVVGVLDMQSRQADALNLENVVAFQALAGQLAVAVQNATFLAEVEAARADVENQARRLSRTNWTEYLDAIHKPEHTGFAFEQNKIVPLTEMDDMSDVAGDFSAPIEVTGEELGKLVLALDEQSQTPQAKALLNTVAAQVSRQIESLRLLESAERYRTESEQASRRLTRDSWKDYAEANSEQSLGFVYDSNEVRPVNGDRKTMDSDTTLPVKVRDETIGTISLGGHVFDDPASLELANAIADRLGAHIENLRLFDQTQATLVQSEKLFEASRNLTQANDLQELVSVAVGTLKIAVVNRALLAVFNYDSDDKLNGMNIVANWWSGTGHEATPIGTYYSAEALRVLSIFTSPTPIFFNDMYNDDRVDAQSLDIVKRLNVRAMIGLPLFLGARHIGTLILESEEVHNFSQDDVRLFTALAPQIATVLENRRQFERAQKQAERESTLNTISQKIQSATTVEAVLQIAARELGHALGAPMTIAQLSMKDNKS